MHDVLLEGALYMFTCSLCLIAMLFASLQSSLNKKFRRTFSLYHHQRLLLFINSPTPPTLFHSEVSYGPEKVRPNSNPQRYITMHIV